ncbi:MAG: hypothetical protein AVDCRST_MAG08-3026 [uncultured Acetobacteraceae bacterium]|uniref:DUF3108 domain-containing protein n=1 Tax=uncultured Acetobacteraceae bacterium TaxID=169975 RepID=A0A6J4J5R6_9PROT|nr:MAG: hypothetical protein AVDCRST_MAG08-3026 [uncultured Acetobacteraceae bacterium]
MILRPAATVVALAASVLSAPSPARAEAVLARYEVRARGLHVMQAEVLFDLSGPRYRVQTRVRPVGVAVAFAGGGEQVSSTEGSWRGADPQPRRHSSEGEWRGGRRAVQLDYAPPAGGAPLLRVLEPPLEPEREPVPEALKRNTVDGLSAVAKLLRTVAQTGRCEGEAPVFDGRRRSDFRAWTESMDDLPRGNGAFAGPALRCAFLGKLVAGRHAEQERENAGRPPQPVVAWVARPLPGRAAVPVLIEMPTRWFGTIRVVLASVEPAGS